MQPEPPAPSPQSWEHLFDRDPHSAVDAVSEWRFAPSTLHRQPIRIRYVLTVRFTLS
jgi:hypothetical protein